MSTPAAEEALFQAAISLALGDRASYLDRACAGEPALRARLDTLLAAHDQPDTFDVPAYVAPGPTISLDMVHDSIDPTVGLTLGRYKLLERLGEGGRGVVYVAEQTEPVRRRVALKVIKPGMDSKAVIARFEAERQALAIMDHPNIGRRYETATGLASDLRRHLDYKPVDARPPGTVYRLQKAWQRHRIAFSVGGTLAGVLLSSIVILSWALREQSTAREAAETAQKGESFQRAKAEADRAVASAERDLAACLLAAAQAAQGIELLERNDPVGLFHLLEARKTVDHLSEERTRFTQLWSGWMEALPKPEIRTLPVGNCQSSLAFSPGQPWIATGDNNGDVVIWHATTGKEIGRFNTGKARVFSPEFSANGRLLIVNAGGEQQLDPN